MVRRQTSHVLCQGDCQVARCTGQHSVRQRCQIYLQVLAEFSGGDGHRDFDELSISSIDRRAEREDDSDTRGLVESLLLRIERFLGPIFGIGRFHL